MGLAEELSLKNDDTVVISATRSIDNAVFKKELDSLSSSRMKVSYIMSNDPEWEGEKGFLTEEALERLAPDYKEREIYFCGPPLMFKTVMNIVEKAGIPKAQFHYEKFSL